MLHLRCASDDERHDLDLVTITADLEHPGAWLSCPTGRVLVTERPGRLRVVERDDQEGPAVTACRR